MDKQELIEILEEQIERLRDYSNELGDLDISSKITLQMVIATKIDHLIQRIHELHNPAIVF